MFVQVYPLIPFSQNANPTQINKDHEKRAVFLSSKGQEEKSERYTSLGC